VGALDRLLLQLLQVAFELVETLFPQGAILQCPVGGLLERRRRDATRAKLAVAPLSDEAGSCENAQMLADGRRTHIERSGQIANGGLALRQPGEDGASRRVSQRGKCDAEMVRFQLFFQLVN